MSPTTLAALMMIASGAAHATVNAIVKSGKDKLSSRALVDGFSGIIVVPLVFLVPLPGPAWAWLIAGGVIKIVYLGCMIKAFEHSDLSVAYPIARGVAPVVAAMLAVVVFDEPITLLVAAGILAVSAGVMVVGLGLHVSRAGLSFALATGVCIALYTVIDAQGVRVAPTAASYIVWDFAALGISVGGLFAVWRGRAFLLAARSEWKPGLMAGVLSLFSYGLALTAFRLGDTPRLAALREISIVFAVGIAVVFLKEKMTAARIAGVGTIALGAVLLLVAR